MPLSPSLDPKLSLLLADILPTGCFAAMQVLKHPNWLNGVGRGWLTSKEQGKGGRHDEKRREMKVAVIGLGPVGVVRSASQNHSFLGITDQTSARFSAP